MTKVFANITEASLKDAVFDGLAAYGERLGSDFRFSRSHAARLRPVDSMGVHYKKPLGSRTIIEMPHISAAGFLSIVALAPHTGTGNYSQYSPPFVEAGRYGATGTPLLRRIGGTGIAAEVVLGVASFDPDANDPTPVLHALHLDRTVMSGSAVVRAATVGQTRAMFERSMAEGAAEPNATRVVDTAPGAARTLPPVYALFNDTDALQVAGLVSIPEASGTFHRNMLDLLGAQLVQDDEPGQA